MKLYDFYNRGKIRYIFSYPTISTKKHYNISGKGIIIANVQVPILSKQLLKNPLENLKKTHNLKIIYCIVFNKFY